MTKDVHDSYVAEHIHQALASDQRVNEPELQVHVVAGRAVIMGDVPTDARRAAIDEVVRELHPDLAVDNQTSVIGTTAAGPSMEHMEGVA
jgi:osmotically-inducible protein OsmY